MAVKKSNPIGTLFTIIVVLAVAAALYYGLVIATQAGPAAQEAADRAELRLTSEDITNISYIPYSMLSEAYKISITEAEYNEVMGLTAPSEKTIALYEKLNAVVNEPKLLQGASTYYCGSPENPIVGTMKIKGIEYQVSHAVEFAPNVKTFEPEVIKWTVTVERLTYA